MKHNEIEDPSALRLAMVICIRNEARFLAANLLYHRAMGVEQAYVYLDRCSDESEEIAASFPWVKTTRVAPEDGARFDYVPDFQAACMDRALAAARAEGIQWLLTLDADEFAVADNRPTRHSTKQTAAGRGDLRRMLALVHPRTEQVRLASRELVPVDLDPSEPIWKQQHFLLDPDYCRDMLDPVDGVVKQLKGFSGHAYGKSIVRTSAAVQAFNPHEWTRYQGVHYPDTPGRSQLRTEFRGNHLHFVVVDWAQWLDKNRKFNHEPSKWRMGGEVPFPKQCWKEAAPQFTDQQAREYFRDWVATSESKLQTLVSSGVVTHDNIVEQVLRESGVLVENELQLPRQPQTNAIEDWKMPESFWRDGPNGVIHCVDGEVRYVVSSLSTHGIQGLFGPYFNGQQRYRLAEAKAEVAIDVPPADYAVTLHIPQWNAQSMTLSLDGQTVDRRRRPGKQDALTIRLSPNDFMASDGNLLRVELHPTVWQRIFRRSPTAGLAEISFQPLPRAA